MSTVEYVLLAAVLLYAIVLRGVGLHHPLYWVDEAESAINALTILEHGYPVDHYLGLPIYENTLTIPWPQSEEYEFKDSSYSAKGVAIYHGWLPLYSIAASLKAFGIAPDPPPVGPWEQFTPVMRRSAEDVWRLTVAARLPAVVFGVAFLLVLFAAGRELGGRDVAWSAVLVATVANRTIDVAREARYYSATALLGMACCLMVFRMAKHGRWRDFVLGGVLFGLLFHTHIVTFLVASASMVLTVLVTRPKVDPLRKLGGFATIVAFMTVPWAILTGFLGHAAGIPKAWPLLRFPADYLLFPMSRPPSLIVLALGLLALLIADAFRRRLPPRFVNAFVEHRGAFYLLAAWIALGYLAFIFLMPAVSFVADRMTLPMLGPGILLAAMIFAAVGRVLVGRATPVVASALFLGFMFIVQGVRLAPVLSTTSLSKHVEYTLDWLRGRELRPGTRVYATPNKHLIFTVYTGMPVQSIAPVRKSFLDSYPGDVLVIDCAVPFQPPPQSEVLAAAEAAGEALSEADAKEMSWLVTNRAIAAATAELVERVDPQPSEISLPDYLLPLVERQPAHTALHLKYKSNPIRSAPAVFRGYELKDWTDWWPVYFYRFASPEKRSGSNLNYAERARTGHATILPIGWRVYEMPAADRGHVVQR